MMKMNLKNRVIHKELVELDRKLTKIEDASTRRVLRGFKRDLVDIRDILDKLYNEYEVDGEFNHRRFKKLKDNIMLDKYVSGILINRYINIERETKATLSRIAETTFGTMKNIKEIPAIKKEFNVAKIVNDEMAGLKWTERYGVKRSEAIKNIQTTIKQGLESGDTYTTMSKKLGEKMSGEAYQIDRIIRTESHRVHAQTKADTLDELARQGVKMTKTWLTSQDERVRSSHAEMDGVTIPYEDDFILPGGHKANAPMDSRLPASEVINCRCILVMNLE